MSKVSVHLPQEVSFPEKEIAFKVSTIDGPLEKRQTFRSFCVPCHDAQGSFMVNQKYISSNELYKVLLDHGISKTVPCTVHLGDEDGDFFTNFDWKPEAAPLFPSIWEFTWNDVTCSITGRSSGNSFGGGGFWIRVHDMTEGVGEKILDELGAELLKRHIEPEATHDQIIIYQHAVQPGADPYWQQLTTRLYRDISTIYIDETIKSKMVKQLTKFMESSTLYDRYGVVWKRVHLFHGPPGSGKSSTVAALASHFKRNIAKLEISPDLDSRKLAVLFQTIPDNTFILVEDIDALFVERKAETMISFSSLLNCLDGIATRRGLVVFMTTNHVTKLDPAMLRPGRVDCAIEFQFPGTEELRKALQTLGSQFAADHEEYLKRNSNISIAALQQHLFECIMEEKATIL